MDIQNRPVHLDLMRMKFPPMAIVSILHRVSGVLLFLLLPFALYLLQHSLMGSSSFNALHEALSASLLMQLGVWVLLSATAYHLLAGIRHLLMDFGVGEQLKTARFSAYLLMIVAAALVVLLGVWVWM